MTAVLSPSLAIPRSYRTAHRIAEPTREEVALCMPMGLGLKMRIAAAGGGPWSPLTLGSALKFWVRADLGFTGSGWADQSGSGDPNKNLVQVTPAKQPTLNATDSSYNNQATLSFASASSQDMSSGTWAASLALPEWVFQVGNFDAGGANQYMTDGVTTNTRPCSNGFTAVNGVGIYNGVTLTHRMGQPGAPQILIGYFDTGANSKIYSSAPTPVAVGNAGTVAANRTDVSVGGPNGGGVYLNGKIAEVFIVAGPLSGPNFTSALAYCGTRYGISVWDPSQLSGLSLWLRADLGFTGAAWADQSGNGNNFAQANAPSQPSIANAINNQATAHFGGTQSMSGPNFATSGAKSMIIVYKMASTPGSGNAVSPMSLNTGSLFSEVLLSNLGGSYQPFTAIGDESGATTAVGTAGTLDTSAHALIWTYSGGTNTSVGSYTSVLDNTSNSVVASSTINRVSSDLTSIGARLSSGNSPSFGLTGDIAEVIVTSAVLSNADEANLATYLFNRYGVP